LLTVFENKAIFIDRDGVLNKAEVRDGKPYAPRSYEDFIILPGTEEALTSLKQTGYILIIVTNQPDVGNGFLDKKIVEEMHTKLLTELPINAVKVCYHRQIDECKCRKPKPGMIFEAASDFNINLNDSYMIGDRKSDIEAGIAAGCRTVFIEQGYVKTEQPENVDIIASSLPDAVTKVLFHISNNYNV